MTLHLAGALRARASDCDSRRGLQRPFAGAYGRRPGRAVVVPGSQKVALPRTANGIAVFSMGSLIAESEALEFEGAAHGESHTWRATREFSLLGEILRSFEWGALDLLMFDLPPGAERTVQYADYLGPRTSFVLVTIPSEVSRGVVARSVAALSKGRESPARLRREHERLLLPHCNAIKPLFASSSSDAIGVWRSGCLGTVPFDPELARHCDRGIPFAELSGHACRPGPGSCRASSFSTASNRRRSSADEVPVRSCDTPMKLQTVGPPDRGSLSIVYACPECGYEMAMLTNAYETQVVTVARRADRPGRRSGSGSRLGLSPPWARAQAQRRHRDARSPR